MVELADDPRGSAGRRQQAEPDFLGKACHADFHHGRRIWQLRPTSFARHRKRLQLACLEIREQAGLRVENPFDVPSTHLSDCVSALLLATKRTTVPVLGLKYSQK